MSNSHQDLKVETSTEIQPDMLIVGAGPVGISFAITTLMEAKKNNQKVNIVMLERHVKYKREQRLKLKMDLITHPELKTKILELIENKIADWIDKDKVYVDIPIKALEDCLVQQAKKMVGIKIVYQQFMTETQAEEKGIHPANKDSIKNRAELEKELGVPVIIGMDEIAKQYPKCKIVIGADGASSSIRDLMIGDEEKESFNKTDLRYMIEVKYEVQGEVKKSSSASLFFTETYLRDFVCLEHVKYNAEKNRTTVTLRFLVDKETYDDKLLRGVNVKNLLPLTRNIPEKLASAIAIWATRRGDNDIVFGTPFINKTTLSILSSKKYCLALGEVLLGVLGDAACGFPYMTGLNLGLENATRVAKLIIEHLEGIKNGNAQAIAKFLKLYAEFTKNIFQNGTSRVQHANKKVEYQEYAITSVRMSTLPIKASMTWHYENFNHPVFYAHTFANLTDLRAYVNANKRTPSNQYYKLSSNLLNWLERSGSDFEFMDKLLCVAQNKFLRLQAEHWIPRFFNIRIESAVSTERRTSLEEKEIRETQLTTMNAQDKGAISSFINLGDIIADLYHEIKNSSEKYKLLETVYADIDAVLPDKNVANTVRMYLA